MRFSYSCAAVDMISTDWATVCKTVRLMLSDRCLSCLSVLSVFLSTCDVGVLWPNVLTDQDETWHTSTPRPWRHCVRWGPNSPSPKRAQPPIFGPYPLRPNGCIDQVGMEVGLGPGDFVLDGDPAPPFPNFRPMFIVAKPGHNKTPFLCP